MSKKILGLDIGIASVGWALIEDGKRIIDLGVRTFDIAEVPKTKESLNKVRRDARQLRHRLSRRASRLKSLLSYLLDAGLINSKDHVLKNPNHEDIWKLRNDALNKQLTSEQLALIIYHTCKHRGFYWSNSANTNLDDGIIKQRMSANEALMQEKGYQTVGKLIFNEHQGCYRNKSGDYSKSLPRVLISKELEIIFKKQRDLGNTSVTADLILKVLGTGYRKSGYLWQQKPSLQGDGLLAMVGRCRFEKGEIRAPVSNFLAERHVWLTRLINLRVVDPCMQVRPLTKDEFDAVINLPYSLKSDIKYKQIAAKLIKLKLWPKDTYTFDGLNYDEEHNPEDAIFCKFSAWHKIRKAYEDHDLKEQWQTLADETLSGNYQKYNQIALILSVYKDDEEVNAQLKKLNLGDNEINALIDIRFAKFSALSEKALSKIVPYMEQGLRFDEACSKVGFKHYLQSQEEHTKSKYLPPLYIGKDKTGSMILNDEIEDLPKNPVVLRAINQTRNVVNAVIKKYGSPSAVHVELGRELTKTKEERSKLTKKNADNKKANEKLKADFIKNFGESSCNRRNLEKYRLYIEQDGKSMYSGKRLELRRLIEDDYVQVDHVLPLSKSFDDSLNNKVLVLTVENQNKGNQTPYEFFMARHYNWQEYVTRVKSNHQLTYQKKKNLLNVNFDRKDPQEFKTRSLTDTRSASKFVKNYIDKYLLLDDNATAKTCTVVPGPLTNYLRFRWGLTKDRSQNDRHHALDAIVIACCSKRLLQQLASYSRNKELRHISQVFTASNYTSADNTDDLTYPSQVTFPVPWENFKTEVELRVNRDSLSSLISGLKGLDNYTEADLKNVKPLFVSRAVKRRGFGNMHGDTIYRQTPELAKNELAVNRVPLKQLNLRKLENMVDKDLNQKLYHLLKQRLEEFDDNAEKAFADDNPIYMPSNDQLKQGPIIKKVSLLQVQTGVNIRNGIAANGSIVRVDLFKKKDKYYAIPIYPWNKELPNKAVVSNKPERMWLEIDDTYEWCMSFSRNDYIKITMKDKTVEGYFLAFDRQSARITIRPHDGGFGSDTRICFHKAKDISKFLVDILGNTYPAPFEERLAI